MTSPVDVHSIPDEQLPTFSVIVPTYNRCAVGEKTIDGLLACDYPDDRYELIICDNSSDGTPEMVKRKAEESSVPIHLIFNDERLPAVKRNQGLALAGGEYVCFMNDDVWVTPTFLKEHLRTHLQYAPEPIAVLGHCEQSGQMPDTAYLAWYRPFAYHLIADHADGPVPYQFNWSMNLSLPRSEMLGRNLVFHEDWANIGHEDVELGFRWQNAGNRLIYNPRAWGEHYHPHTLDSTCDLQVSIGRGLRDLEVLIPERELAVTYGLFKWSNPPARVARQLVRKALFNRWTAPFLRRRLATYNRRSRLAEWAYPKIVLHYMERGYREQGPRCPAPTPIHDRPLEQLAS